MKCFFTSLSFFFSLLLVSQTVFGQVTGVKMIPGDYNTLEEAIIDLNTYGVGPGGAEIHVGEDQQAPAGGYRLGSSVLNASLNASNPLLIHGHGNTVTANVGTGDFDGIFLLRGTDYVTVESLHLQDRSTNTTDAQRMEWGYALLKFQNQPPMDGCQHVSIRNCSISLRLSTNKQLIGIYSAPHRADTFGMAPIANYQSPADGNSYNTFDGNRIEGCKFGILLMGIGNNANRDFHDEGNVVGDVVGNEINVGIISGTTSIEVAGIYVGNNKNLRVDNNVINATPTQRGNVYGINLGTLAPYNSQIHRSGSIRIRKNRLQNWTNVNGAKYGISVIGGDSILVKENEIENITTNSAAIEGIKITPAPVTAATPVYGEVSKNRISGISTTTGILKCIEVVTGSNTALQFNLEENQINDVLSRNGSGTDVLLLYSPVSTSNRISRISKNRITNIATSATLNVFDGRMGNTQSTIDSNFVANVFAGKQITVLTLMSGKCYGNTFDSIVADQGTLTLVNFVNNSSQPHIYNNRFLRCSTNLQTGFVRAINLGFVRNQCYVYNNIVDYTINDGYSQNTVSDPTLACFFYYHSSFSNYHIHRNTIKVKLGQLGSQTGFVVHAVRADNANLFSSNNIIHLEATSTTSAVTSIIYRKMATTPPQNAFVLRNNIYYHSPIAGVYLYSDEPGATKFSIVDDPAFNQPCGLYKTYMRSNGLADTTSYFEDNLVYDPNESVWTPTGSSLAKEGGVQITNPIITNDLLGVLLPTNPDIGAVQFAGIPADRTKPEISFTPLAAQSCDTIAPILKTVITDDMGLALSSGLEPRLYYRKRSESNAFGNYPGDNNSGFNGWKFVTPKLIDADTFYFELDYGLLTSKIQDDDEIEYFVIAQDQVGNTATNTASFAIGFCVGGVQLLPGAGPLTAPTYFFKVKANTRKTLDPATPQSICGGTTVKLEVPESGNTHVWLRNDTVITAATEPEYFVSEMGDFSTFVNTNTCFYTTEKTKVSTSGNPIINVVGNTSKCAGDSTFLYIDSTLNPTQSYEWLLDGVSINHTYAGLFANAMGDYKVIAKNGSCADTSLPISITQLPAPDVTLTTLTGDTFFCSGSSLTLQTISGHQAYRWKRDGLDVATSGDSYVATLPGSYQVVATGTNGCTDSSALKVITADTAHVSIAIANTHTICSGDSVIISVRSVSGSSYEWKRDGVVLASDSASLIAKATGSYKVIVETASGCRDSSTAVNVDLDLPNVAISPSTLQTVCSGDSVALVATGGANYQYVWKKDGVVLSPTSNTYSAKETGSYKVIVTTPNNCIDSSIAVSVISDTAKAELSYTQPLTFCKGDSVIFSAAVYPNQTYNWLIDGNLSSHVGDKIIAKGTGSYQLIAVTANTCRDTSIAVQAISDTAKTDVTPTGPITICFGDSVTLSVSTMVGYTHQWYRNGVSATNTPSYKVGIDGQYFVVNETSNGCKDSSDVVIVQVDTPQVSVIASGSLTVCRGDSVRLSAPDRPNYSYRWYRDGATLVGASRHYDAFTSGAYQVVVTTANNCTDTSSVSWVVSDTVIADITALGSLIFCDGDSVVLEAANPSNYTFSWNKDNTPIANAVDPDYVAKTGGDYTVVATSLSGCRDTSAPLKVIVNATPHAVLTLEGDTVICQGSVAIISTTSGPGYSWQWRRNGQPIHNATDSMFEVRFSGQYDVIVSAGNDCTDTSVGLDMRVQPNPVPGIIARGPIMKTGGRFNSYQWYIEHQPIAGATDSVFRADFTGRYKVEVSDSFGCIGVSDYYEVRTLDVINVTDDFDVQTAIRVFPNPASSYVTIEAPIELVPVFYGVDGRLIDIKYEHGTIDISSLPDGVYIIRMFAEDGTYLSAERLVKAAR